MKKLTTIILLSLALVSCSNPMDRKYNEAKLEEDMKAIKESGKMNEQDAELLASWIVMSKLGNEDLSNKTYQQILDEAKNYKKQQQELAEKAKKEEAERADRIKKAIVVSIYGYEYVPGNDDLESYSEAYHNFKCAIQNKTNKEIKAVKFHFNIYNSLGDKIIDGYRMSFTEDKIEPMGMFQSDIQFKFNEFNDEDVELSKSKFENLKFEIMVDKVVYSDGSELM